jgi:chemotaxis signal transduction protein
MTDVVFFELRGRRCALPVSVVLEVMAGANVTPVPLAPMAVRGVAPLHGQMTPVLDLGVYLASAGQPNGPADEKWMLIEASIAGEAVRAALAVDKVMRLGTVEDNAARRPPPGPTFVTATVLDADGPALLLDVDRALAQVQDALRGTNA